MNKIKDEGEQTWLFEETVEGEHGFVDIEEGHNVGTMAKHGFVGTKEGSNVSVAYPVTLHPF